MNEETVRLKYRHLLPTESFGDERKLDLKVIFTDLTRTAAALTAARNMALGLGARITVLVAQVVPYPLPLSNPPVPVEFTERVLASLAPEDDDQINIEIYLCRDRFQAIHDALPPESLVILGARRWWWPAWERSLARLLRREGRRVLTV